MVVIVFGRESSVPADSEMFTFVQEQMTKWKNYTEFIKVNIDQCPGTAVEYGVKSAPAFVFREKISTFPFQDKFHEAHRIIGEYYQEEFTVYIVRK